jgi:hypothetical protein
MIVWLAGMGEKLGGVRLNVCVENSVCGLKLSRRTHAK